jgi:flagellar motility protein MotE (MotC chaperone)
MYRALYSLRSKGTRPLVVFSSAPKSFAAAATAKSTEQKRPFWATTPVQKKEVEEKDKVEEKVADEKDDKTSFTTKQLVKAVAETHDLTQAESRRIIDTVFDTISVVRTSIATTKSPRLFVSML